MPNIPVSTALTEDSSIAEFKTKQNFQKKKEKEKKNPTQTQPKQPKTYKKLSKNGIHYGFIVDRAKQVLKDV